MCGRRPFVRVLTLVRANQIREPERLGALVNSVCNNVLLEHYRAKGRNTSNIDEIQEDRFVAPENDRAGAESREAQLLVRTILRELPDRDRRLLQLVLLEERDKDAVCAELGCLESTCGFWCIVPSGRSSSSI